MAKATAAVQYRWVPASVAAVREPAPADGPAPRVLAVNRHLAASTQNQALSGLLFLSRPVLHWSHPGWTRSCARSARCSDPHVLRRPAAVRSPADRMFGP